MADRKVEPVEHTDEHRPTSSQNDPKDAQSTSSLAPEGTQPPAKTSTVRNTVLDEVVANQDKQIAELERKVEKKKETIRKLSVPSPFIPQPGLSVVTPHIPPSTVPQASASLTSPAVRPQASKPNPSPTVINSANSSQQQPHQSQPLAHNPAMAATVAAMAAASTPVSTALHPHFSFFPYPHPDNHVMTFGVVPTLPPHRAAQPLQASKSATPSQPNQSSDDGANRQSRYWTPDEHQRFLAGRRTYGPRNYQQIAEVVGTRNAKQVRTHSQKYQQKLEREEARRRGDGRISSDVHSGVKAVAPKVAASSDGNSTPAPDQTRQSDVHRNGSSPVPGKNSQSNETPQSSESAEGSSNANNGSTEAAAENSINSVHANAAARAVVAEAVALSRGKLPPGAIVMLEKPREGQSQHGNLQTQYIHPTETIGVKQDSCHTQSAPSGMDATGSVAVAQNGNQSTSHATNHLLKHNTNSSPGSNVQVATSIPVGRGDDIHKVTEPGNHKELANRELAKAPSREQPNPSVNGALIQTRQSPEKRPDRKQGRSAVKIEPRIVSSVTSTGASSGSHHDTKVVTQSNLTVPIETKSTVNPVTKTVKINGSAERIEGKIQRSVIKSKPAEVTLEKKGAIPLRRNNSLAAHPEKRILPNGHRPSANSSEVKSREESQSSKMRDSLRSPKSNTSVEVQCEASSPPRPNGFPQGSNSSITFDAEDIKGRRQKSVAIIAKREEGESNGTDGTNPKYISDKEAFPTTEAVETKDEGSEWLDSRNSKVIRRDQEKAKDIENNVEFRTKDETRAPRCNEEVASSSALNKRIPNGGTVESTKYSQAMGSEASQERRRGDYVENMMEAETKGAETRMAGVMANGDAHKDSKNGKTSVNRGDESVRGEEGGGSDHGEGKGDKAVETGKDTQDMKRKLEDMTESAGKRQKV